MERNRGGRPRHPDVLTPAEWRVLDALREGGTNAEIASRLGLSLDTVKSHISNMLAKLELRDRRALAAWRPDAQRRRLGGVLAVPAALWSVGRPLLWVGAGVAALAGVAVVVVALVALEGIVEGDGEPSAAVRPPAATPVRASTPALTSTAAPTATPTVAPAPTPIPTATPTATPDPSPTATPAPTPTAQPEPTPGPASSPATATAAANASAATSSCDGIGCIEPVTDAYVRETWEPGEQIGSREWRYGFFFLNTETGRTEGYRGTDWTNVYPNLSIYSAVGPWLKWHGLLINRLTGEAWRWPEDSLTILAISEEHVLVVERAADTTDARVALLDSDMQLVGEFVHSVETRYGTHANFSPDGRTIALVVDLAAAYLIDVESVSLRVLLEGAERAGWERGAVRIERAYRGPGLLVQRTYWRESDESDDVWAAEYSDENRYFAWSGNPLPGSGDPFFSACRDSLSPDGRYVVREEGAPVGIAYNEDWVPTADPWPSVVIADARTCEPLFRIRSALVGPRWFPESSGGSWLADSSGYVLDVDHGGMMVRISEEPELVALPSWGGRLVAAPTGGGHYFANLSGVWDSREDTWVTASLPSYGEVREFPLGR